MNANELLRGAALVCAAPAEAAGLAELGVRAHVLGVGKAAMAAALTELLLRDRPRAVLLFGVCGAFPKRHRATATLQVGDVCVVGSDRFGDEGVLTPRGFRDLAELGLGDCGPFVADAALLAAVATPLGAPVVAGVTVSTCSGTEASSAALAARHAAAVETMEGAAAALAAARTGTPFAQLRAVSNSTGDRDRAGWDLARAAAALQQALRRLAAAH